MHIPSIQHLLSLPTLAQGQTSNLKIDTGTLRIWVSRCTVADGEPCNNRISIERMVNGRWIEE